MWDSFGVASSPMATPDATSPNQTVRELDVFGELLSLIFVLNVVTRLGRDYRSAQTVIPTFKVVFLILLFHQYNLSRGKYGPTVIGTPNIHGNRKCMD